MAKQKGNVVTHGLSGKIGDLLVFRQTKSGTVVQSPPRVRGKASELQREQRQKFQRAVSYANTLSSDPVLEAAYAAKAKPGQKARHVAIADFLRAPDINAIDVSGYHGQPGDVIRIDVTDNFAVREVKVVITASDDSPVEEGYAQPEATGYEWTYKVAQTNNDLPGSRIEIYASDVPGNISTATKEL
jgi:hypothetical protein